MKRWRLMAIPGLLLALLMVGSAGIAEAGGPGETGNGTIPPGFTKVTFVHHAAGPPEVIVEHGPNGKGGPVRGEANACTTGAGTDQCDSFKWDGQFWPGAAVTYNVNLENSGGGDTFRAAIQDGAQTWEDDPNSGFDFTFGGETGRKASSLRNRMDGYNDVTWDGLNKYQNPIAVAIFWYYTSTGEVVEADLINNKNFPWASDGDPNAYDVQNIDTHEFGHFLVLGDLYDGSESELTMYGYGARGETKKRFLGLGDQLGIRTIYPLAGPLAPVADAGPDQTVSDGDGDGVESVTLDGSGSYDPDGAIASYEWDIDGDGVTDLTGDIVTDTFAVGTHTITLSVTDSDGLTDQDDVLVTVNPNQAPVADAGLDQTVSDGDGDGVESVTLDGSGSYDPDGTIASYEWTEGAIVLGTTASITVSLALGTHTITLLVTDNVGGTGTDDVVVTVAEPSAEPTTVSVASITYATEGGRNGDKHLSITVALEDNLGNPVAGASVSIDVYLDGSLYGSGTGITGTDGTVTFKANNAPSGCYTTTVTNVAAGLLTWDGAIPVNELCK